MAGLQGIGDGESSSDTCRSMPRQREPRLTDAEEAARLSEHGSRCPPRVIPRPASTTRFRGTTTPTPADTNEKSVFIPPAFRIDDRETLYAFVERYSFATLVSVHDHVPFATHVPLLFDRVAGVLVGHLAKGNPQCESFLSGAESLAIFAGPHAYISPSWYATAPAVPTWNYAAVHVYGVPRLLSPDRTRAVVDLTVATYEHSRPTPWPNALPEDFRRRLLAGVVGFEMPLARVEGKFKLGQNRPEADQVGMLDGLRGDGVEAERLAEFIRWYRGLGPSAEPRAAADSR